MTEAKPYKGDTRWFIQHWQCQMIQTPAGPLQAPPESKDCKGSIVLQSCPSFYLFVFISL